ncbi:MAG TPA: phosphoribosylanthranilate isomerase [Conexibacter sp.]|nr:phosphoribosylanthranilate isomerase [Conexibacter sp.]
MSDHAPTSRIKFCGVTRLQDAEHAAELGAWAVGMILWSGSARRCSRAEAEAIGAALHRRTEVAGVFVNAHLDQVAEAADAFGLTLLQFHGDEGPVYCNEAARRTGAKVIKAARVAGRSDIRDLRAFQTDFHLLDAHVPGKQGGTGETFAWELASEHPRDRPLILSGGLHPGNVADAIAAVRPFAVDVASGVELEPGVKDHVRMTAFAEAVRATAPRSESPDEPDTEAHEPAAPAAEPKHAA